MRLTTIDANMWGLPHRQISLDSKGLLITGPNSTGKTSLLKAVEYGLQGAPRGSADFAVSLGFVIDPRPQGDSPQNRELIRRVEDGRQGAQYGFARKLNEVATAIKSDLGSAHTFDVHAFLAASGRLKAEQLRSVVNLHWDLESVLGELEGLLGDRMPKLTRIMAKTTTTDGQAWVATAVETLRAAGRACKRDLEAARAEARGVESRMATTQRPGGSVASKRAELAELDEELSKLRAQLGALEGEAKGRTTAARTLENLKRKRAAIEASTERVKADIKATAEAIKLSDIWAAEHEAKHTEAVLKAQAAVVRLETAARAAAKAADDLLNSEKLAASASAAADMELESFLVAVVDASQEVPSEALAELAHKANNMLTWVRCAVTPEDLVELRETLEGARSQHEACQRHARTTHQVERTMVATWVDPRPRDQAKGAAAVEAAERLRSERAANAEEISVAEQDLASIPALADGANPIQARIDGLVERRTALVRIVDQLNDLVALDAQLEAARSKIGMLVASREAAQATEADVRAYLGRRMQADLVALTEPASAITQNTVGADLRIVLDEKGEASLYLGTQPLDKVSESEQIIAGAALQAAVEMSLPGWSVLLLDGLEALQPARRTDLLAALAASGLDNFIAAAVADGWSPKVPGVQELNLESP